MCIVLHVGVKYYMEFSHMQFLCQSSFVVKRVGSAPVMPWKVLGCPATYFYTMYTSH